MTLTAEELREILRYDPETGVFTRRIQTSKRIKAGDVCKTVAKNGYILISVKNRRYTAHRLAWLYVHGEWPAGMIDHANGVRTDNRIANLRIATQAQQNGNQRLKGNNSTGRRGVCWCNRRHIYRVYITKNGKQKHIGYFADLNEASDAWDRAAMQVFGEFARLNADLVSRVPESTPALTETANAP